MIYEHCLLKTTCTDEQFVNGTLKKQRAEIIKRGTRLNTRMFGAIAPKYRCEIAILLDHTNPPSLKWGPDGSGH